MNSHLTLPRPGLASPDFRLLRSKKTRFFPEVATSLLTAILAMLCPLAAGAQHLPFPTDEQQRGYYDRPYLRYEAEDGWCESWSGAMLFPPEVHSQSLLQSEASRGSALRLDTEGDYVEWICDADADGMTLRFSIPDSADGTGTSQTLAMYVGDEKLCDITLNSAHAWQYTSIANTPEKYPDNSPSTAKFARMRFDEVSVLLPRRIKAGEVFRLVKGDVPEECTIDFVELEPVDAPLQFVDVEGDKVMYEGNGSTLQSFINANKGKVIYIPAGVYEVPRKLVVNGVGTQLLGAGMWHTRIHFTADPANRSTCGQRGIECNADNVVLDGFTLSTVNDRRYYDNNPSWQTGKGLNGSFGANSVIRNLRIDHFECGAWIADYSGVASKNLRIEHCRMRNNYADGINLCSGTEGAVVTHCSFRNNGDDDMASWSTGSLVSANEFSYCTSENNWRASGLGFFGGADNRAHHLYVVDGLEEGVRVNGEFPGTGMVSGRPLKLNDITIERCGDCGGTPGVNGGFWGSSCPSLHLRGGYHTDVKGVEINDFDIIDSRWRGINISNNGQKGVYVLTIKDVHVQGVGRYEYGLYVEPGTRGDASYGGCTFTGCVEPFIENASRNFTLTDLDAAGTGTIASAEYRCEVQGNVLTVRGLSQSEEVELLTPAGVVVATMTADNGGVLQFRLPCAGIWILGRRAGGKINNVCTVYAR